LCVDDNSYIADGEINIIKYDNVLCENAGFKSSVLDLNNRACSRDKALYHFCNDENLNYNYIWFIEEDVFIPSLLTICEIDNKYTSGDLLCKENNIEYSRKRNEWHWDYVFRQITFEPPYSKSMICAVRCSKQMLASIKSYAQKYNNLFMDEVLFPTLALHNNLEIINPPELDPIVWRNDWKLSDIKCNNLYHPIKDIAVQCAYRAALNE
jgi:hypothetical protein